MRLILLLAFCQLGQSIQLGCTNHSVWSSASLPKDHLLIPSQYAAIVSLVHAQTNETIRINEKDFGDVFVSEKTQKDKPVQTFLLNQGRLVVFDSTSCSAKPNDTLTSIYPLPQVFRDLLSSSLSNVREIVAKVLNQTYDASFDSGLVQVDGLPAVKWTGCMNATDKRDAVEVRINFVGERTPLSPFSTDLPWPQVLNIELIAYSVQQQNGSQPTYSVKEEVTISVLSLDKINMEEKSQSSQLPRGLFCDGFNATTLPNSLPQRFEANLEYIDTDSKLVDTVELMYDAPNHILAFALDFSRDVDIPYVQNNNKTGMQDLGRARVFLDFKTGFEYRLSKDGRVCRRVAPLQKSWAAVQEEADGRLALKDPTNELFNLKNAGPIYNGGQVTHESVTCDSYVTRKVDNTTQEQVVIEILFHSNGWKVETNTEPMVHSIIQYHKNASGQLVHKTVLRFNQLRNNTLVGTSWSKHTVFPCLSDGTADNFFFLKLANGTMAQLQDLGFENVESALAEAIAGTANISVLRVSQFLLKQLHHQLMACFILGEKNNMSPTNTTTLLVERNVTEVKNVLNETLQTQQININIVSDDLKTKTITVNAMGVVSTEEEQPLPPPAMPGYSGGSMFILALFCFMFGSGLTVAGYIFYTKRQGIRGIAYQVFE